MILPSGAAGAGARVPMILAGTPTAIGVRRHVVPHDGLRPDDGMRPDGHAVEDLGARIPSTRRRRSTTPFDERPCASTGFDVSLKSWSPPIT